MITYETIKQNTAIRTYIERADDSLKVLGYTEHSFAHVCRAAETAGGLLAALGYDARTIELAKIAGYLHDIGNGVNRVDHAHSGAILAYNILKDMGMDIKDRMEIMSAIGNHDEATGTAVSDISAALILADKSDVHRDRVVNTNMSTFDIHDRVNYSVKKSALMINNEKTIVNLELNVDTQFGSVMDYFEIFMARMILCRKAAERLGLQFKLMINEQPLI